MNVTKLKESPCGELVPTIEGQLAFVPAPLPRQLDLSPKTVYLLDNASRAVAPLAGIGEPLPNPPLLSRPFLRREAVLSSKIEGTQTSMSDLLLFEASGERRDPGDAREVANYIHALELGIELLDELPLSVRLSNQIHARLLTGVRGQEKTPGEIRSNQNWIGSHGTPIQDARYIPPPPTFIRDLLSDWERFANEPLEMPPLIQSAMLHYQFEAIHPYFDGNGRIGRLLIILHLCAKGILPKPLLYLSAYFERNRNQYYDHLYELSASGNWEPWLQYFLLGVTGQAEDAVVRSRRIRSLHEEYRLSLQERRASANTLTLLDHVFVNPYMSVPRAHELLGVTRGGAKRIVERLVDAQILEYRTGSWPKLYVARTLLEVLEIPTIRELAGMN